VYPGATEAQASFDAFGGFAYAYTPESIPMPSRCTSVGGLGNTCAVLVGNVLVYGEGTEVDLGPGFPQPTRAGADALAKAGVAHLERVLGGLP
jgi:hypothetical protein